MIVHRRLCENNHCSIRLLFPHRGGRLAPDFPLTFADLPCNITIMSPYRCFYAHLYQLQSLIDQMMTIYKLKSILYITVHTHSIYIYIYHCTYDQCAPLPMGRFRGSPTSPLNPAMLIVIGWHLPSLVSVYISMEHHYATTW